MVSFIPSKTVAAVVLNWNQSAMTLDCLASLAKQERAIEHIIVVDNGSRPEQRSLLEEGMPAGLRYVPLPENLGFAGGMNAGVIEAASLGATYTWLMNNDAFPEPGCLTALVAALEADPTLAAVTPRLVGADNIEQPAGGQWQAQLGRTIYLSAEELSQPIGGAGYWAVGTAPLFRTDLFQKFGGFDEGFFAYGEEVDLCLRLGEAGYRFRSVPEVRAVHLGQGSSGGSEAVGSPFADYLGVRNLFRQSRKHPPRERGQRLSLEMTARLLDNAGCYQIHGRTDKAKATIQGLIAVMFRESGKPRWYGRGDRVAGWLARHPWYLVRVCHLLARNS